MDPLAADDGLADAAFDLVNLCEILEEEDEEAGNREEPDYVPDFLGSNFNGDHWRTLQYQLSVTTESLRAHPWLHDWARPALSRTAAFTERRCEEQRALINKATVEQAALSLQQHQQSATQLAQLWQSWRKRKDWRFKSSPDYLYYDKDARLQPPQQCHRRAQRSNCRGQCAASAAWTGLGRVSPGGNPVDMGARCARRLQDHG
ncbi:hypothetical protein ABT404_06485 [Streptomyces hyaluromycini]|uniref:Uncharacterized protein n=1 Tax=Streptomyces hyaluromycini TaxID=1377993 RepID=A0ABV1WQM4_9ACTN